MSHLPPLPASLRLVELQRYHRHLIPPDIGAEGQRRLERARMLEVRELHEWAIARLPGTQLMPLNTVRPGI
jgi:hypothetical protein